MADLAEQQEEEERDARHRHADITAKRRQALFGCNRLLHQHACR